MKTALITGAGGLVGSEAVRFFHRQDFDVVGIDNNMRSYFFGPEGSTRSTVKALRSDCKRFEHIDCDVRNADAINEVFQRYQFDLIIHTAAQPSHDWAAKEPITDFSINAQGTLILLEATRVYCADAVFIYTSTNKVYGDNPNRLPLVECETRWEVMGGHPCAQGIDESMSVDRCLHSVFGASKLAADILAQEYGKYFGLKTGIFRGGCLTGPAHKGVELHGFLSYLVKAVMERRRYQVFGYKGKQVRDNIHSEDLVNAFYEFYRRPHCGEVYNIGGGRFSNCSLLEALRIIEQMTGMKAEIQYCEEARRGDHIWYISDLTKFQSHYPEWRLTHTLESTIEDICRATMEPKLACVGL